MREEDIVKNFQGISDYMKQLRGLINDLRRYRDDMKIQIEEQTARINQMFKSFEELSLRMNKLEATPKKPEKKKRPYVPKRIQDSIRKPELLPEETGGSAPSSDQGLEKLAP